VLLLQSLSSLSPRLFLHPLICTALLSLFSNDSGLKTAMLCPLSPIYRYMQSNIIFLLTLCHMDVSVIRINYFTVLLFIIFIEESVAQW
jgi:hypothetical protein